MAFAFATDSEAKEDIITEWPGAGNQTKNKVRAVRAAPITKGGFVDVCAL